MDWEHNDNYLIHYGVKGQKRGVRRYQNEDGSLTSEGRDHYGISERRRAGGITSSGSRRAGSNGEGEMNDIKKYLGGDNLRRGFANWREKRHAQNLDKAKAKGDKKKIDKYQSKYDAQHKANEDMKKYMKESSEDRLVAENAVAIGTGIGKHALHNYRKARARGESGVSAFIETAVPVYGLVKRMQRNKERYGKRIVWSGLDEGENNVL